MLVSDFNLSLESFSTYMEMKRCSSSEPVKKQLKG